MDDALLPFRLRCATAVRVSVQATSGYATGLVLESAEGAKPESETTTRHLWNARRPMASRDTAGRPWRGSAVLQTTSGYATGLVLESASSTALPSAATLKLAQRLKPTAVAGSTSTMPAGSADDGPFTRHRHSHCGRDPATSNAT